MFSGNKIFLPHSDRTSGLGRVCPPCNDKPYVRSQHRMSAVWVLGENLIFSPLSAYPPTPKATKNNLSPLVQFATSMKRNNVNLIKMLTQTSFKVQLS
jgi:hypothetical protein